MIEVYAGFFPDIRFSWQAMCVGTNRYFAMSGFNFDDAAADDYEAVSHLNFIPALGAKMPAFEVVKSEYLLSAAEYERTDIYNLFFRQRDDLNASRGLWAHRDGNNVAFLGVDIPRRYSPADREALDTSLATILPHLQGAFSLMLDLDVRRSRDEQARVWLDTLPAAGFVVSKDGRVSRMNDKAARLCHSGCGIAVGRRGQLKFLDAGFRSTIEARLRRAAISLDPQGPFPIGRSDEGMLSGYCVPLPVGYQDDVVMSFFGGAQREVLLILVDSGDIPPSDPAALSVLLGVTPAEANVLARLCAGEDLREAADELRISYNTARNQIASAAARVGLNRQTQLVATAVHALSQLKGLPEG